MNPLDPEVLLAVKALANFLNERAPLSEEERRRLYRTHGRRAARVMLEDGVTYGRATGAPGTAIGTHNDEDEFRAHLRSIDNDLREQVRIVLEGAHHYFSNGVVPAPYYAWRIAVILRKAKEHLLEAEFAEAFTRHFGNGNGARYSRIAERAVKARGLASRRTG